MGWPVRRVAAIEVPEDDVFLVALAEGEDGSGRNLVVQMPLTPVTDDDERYYIGDDQNRGLYGGVAQWSVSERELSLVLTDEALAILGPDAAGVFPLRVGAAEVEQVRRGLRRIVTE